MKKIVDDEYKAKLKELSKFKYKNKLLLHPRPDRQLDKWAKFILEIGHCPCDPKRLNCPCDQAIPEIKKQGYCHCRLFFSKGSKEYQLLVESVKE